MNTIKNPFQTDQPSWSFQARRICTMLAATLCVVQCCISSMAREVRVVSTSGKVGTSITVSVQFVSEGNENAVAFSLSFDTTRLTFVSAGGLVNPSQLSSGRVGIAIAKDPGKSFTAGTLELVSVTFTAGTVSGDTSLGFSDAPTARETLDPTAVNSLATTYSGGTVTILPKATPVINWSNPADIAYGTALSGTQLNATATSAGANVPGNFAYSPMLGAVLGTGNSKMLSVTFTPSDTATYNSASGTVPLNVLKAQLAVAGLSASNKTYDGGTIATITGTPLPTGLIGSDSVSVSGTPTGAFANKAVGDNKTVTVSGLTLAGPDAGNYTLNQPTLTANITAKVLTVAGLVASNKAYDGGAAVAITGMPQPTGVIGSESVSVSGTPTGAFANKAAGNNKTVTISGLTLAGPDAGSYTLNQPTLIANITAASLTVTGLSANNKTYDGGTTATISGTPQPTGLLGSDSVSVSGTPTGAFANKAVGDNKTVTVSGLTLAGNDAGNYTLNQPTLTANITPASLTVTAENKTRAYGVANPALTPSYSGFVIGENSSVLSGTPSLNTAATPTSSAGPYAITVTAGTLSAANYTFSFNPGTLTVTKATPVITWVDPADIVYPTPLSAAQLNATPEVSGNPTYSPLAGTVLNAGSGQSLRVEFVPTDTVNYTNASKSVTLNVRKAVQTITFDPLPDRRVGEEFRLTGRASSPLPVKFRVVSGLATLLTSDTLRVTGIGPVTVEASQDGDSNYNAAPPVEQKFEVKRINSAPVFDAVPDQTVAEGRLLKITIVAKDSDVPPNQVFYLLGSGAPTGLNLDPTLGELNWTPTEAQGPSTYVITIQATDDGVPPMSATTQVKITVTEVNQSPTLDPISDKTVAVGQTLKLPLKAIDPDIPANTLTFSLGVDAPAGVAIDPATRTLSWTPTVQQGPSVNRITVLATDDGLPNLSTNQTFTVIVTRTNQPPSISAIADQSTPENTATPLIVFLVSDPDGSVESLKLSASSSNPDLVPTPNIVFGGQGTNRTVTVTPAPNLRGAASLTIQVEDDAGGKANTTFQLTVTPALLRITRQPENQTVFAGSSGSLSVTVSSEEALRYQWRFIDIDIPGATNSVYVLNNVQASDDGNYAVLIRSLTGSVTSTVARLTVNVPVQITNQPTNQAVTNRQSASFAVAATGTAPLRYQWFHNGVNLAVADQATLTISNAQRADSGNYQVVVSNFAGPVPSVPATLTVNVPITILEAPASRTISRGESVVLTVVAAGTSPLTYQWEKNGVDLPGATNVNLTFSGAQVSDAGNYRVRVRNVVGTVVSPDPEAIMVSVLVPPSIRTQPASQNVALGTNVTLTVVADGDTLLNYQWQKNGVKITGATSPSLPLNNVQAGNAGNYTVVVANNGGTITSDRASLTLILPILIPSSSPQTAPALIEATEGTFDMGSNETGGGQLARKNAPPSTTSERWFSWTAPSTGIATFNTSGSTFDTVMTIYPGVPLNSPPIATDDDDAGFFASKVSFNAIQGTTYLIKVNGFGGATGRIVVSFKLTTPTTFRLPVIQTQPENRTVAPGTDVTLRIEAQGTSLGYQWYTNGVAIPTATSSNLVLRNVQEANVANYSVRVTTGSGASALTSESAQASLQLGTESTSAQDKFKNAPRLAGGGAQLAGYGARSLLQLEPNSVAHDYMGFLVFSTIGSSTEQGETNHCGVVGGASRWITYQAPTNGVLHVGTDGSDFDTVLAVYSGSGTDFTTLNLESCDNNGGIDGQDSVVNVPVTRGTVYYLAVDGIGGASGLVRLTYELGQSPVISRQPAPRSVAVGTAVTFSVGVTNTLDALKSKAPALRFQWTRDGVKLTGETNSLITIANAQIAATADYAVIVSNFAGSVTSSVARLNVSVPLSIISQPQSLSVREGSRANFAVIVSGSQPITYQWRFNGVDILGATNLFQVIDRAQVRDGGSYIVIAQNDFETITSSSASLTVSPSDEAPRISDARFDAEARFQFQLTVPEGKRAIVQYSTDLIIWTNLRPATGPDFSDSPPINSSARFYRVLME